MKEVFLPQANWDQACARQPFQIAPKGDPIRTWLEDYIPANGGSCLELGCFPGRYLAVLGEMGYEVNGIDLTPRITPDLRDWMKTLHFKVGEFVRGDAFTHSFSRRFDLVCSFGLIEHFGDWPTLLRRHAELVAANGWLLVSTPNFRGFVQRVLHVWLDRRNFEEHNVEAMVPSRWAEVIQPLGFDVVNCGFLGPFDFWVGATHEQKPLHRLVFKTIRRSIPLWRLLPNSVAAYAPYCTMVARRGGR